MVSRIRNALRAIKYAFRSILRAAVEAMQLASSPRHELRSVGLDCFHGAIDMQVMTCISCRAVNDADHVFKALADPSRRKLLDVLNAHNAQSLSELCAHLDITRQAVTQHLDILESAHLVSIHWRGREKLHVLNVVPLQMIYERWIKKFERSRLHALHELKRRLEAG